MTLRLKLTDNFTDTSLTKLYGDELMSKGTLILVETNPVGFAPWSVGVPVTAPNLATESAVALLGSSAIDLSIANSNFSGTLGFAERSAKGGLHGIVPQYATGVTTGNTSHLTMSYPDSLMTYLQANTLPGGAVAGNHLFYFSLWGRNTRPTLETANTNARTFSNLTRPFSGVSGLTMIPQSTNNFKPSSNVGSRHEGGLTAGPLHVNIAGYSSENMVPANYAAAGAKAAATWGRGGQWNGSNVDMHSWVFYRTYLEDLTVSGRSYQEVADLDYAMYTAAVLTPGGRYYGDTFTAPTTKFP